MRLNKDLRINVLKAERVLGKVAKYNYLLLWIIQSIPSPKVDPFMLWLVSTGREGIEETIELELTFDRVLGTYLKKEYSSKWIKPISCILSLTRKLKSMLTKFLSVLCTLLKSWSLKPYL